MPDGIQQDIANEIARLQAAKEEASGRQQELIAATQVERPQANIQEAFGRALAAAIPVAIAGAVGGKAGLAGGARGASRFLAEEKAQDEAAFNRGLKRDAANAALAGQQARGLDKQIQGLREKQLDFGGQIERDERLESGRDRRAAFTAQSGITAAQIGAQADLEGETSKQGQFIGKQFDGDLKASGDLRGRVAALRQLKNALDNNSAISLGIISRALPRIAGDGGKVTDDDAKAFLPTSFTGDVTGITNYFNGETKGSLTPDQKSAINQVIVSAAKTIDAQVDAIAASSRANAQFTAPNVFRSGAIDGILQSRALPLKREINTLLGTREAVGSQLGTLDRLTQEQQQRKGK